MVQVSTKRERRHLLNKMPLVPYADDGPETRALLAKIHNDMAHFGNRDGIIGPNALDEMDKRRAGWTRQLKEARYKDFLSRRS